MNNLIIVDTREKGHKKILEYFDKVGQGFKTRLWRLYVL